MSDEHGTEFQSDSTRRTRDRVRQMERDIAEIKYAIKGNGQPGLVRQVDKLEMNIERLDSLVGKIDVWMEGWKNVTNYEHFKQHMQDVRFLIGRYWITVGAIGVFVFFINLVGYMVIRDTVTKQVQSVIESAEADTGNHSFKKVRR